MTTQVAETHPTRSRILLGVGAVFVVLAVLGILVLRHRRASNVARERDATQRELARGPRVSVSRVGTTSADRTVTLPGDVHGYNESTLYAKLSGYIQDVRVQRGDRVTQGQIIAVIESPETVADLAAAQHSASIARITAGRFETLSPSGVVSDQDRDTAVANHQVAQANLVRAHAILDYAIIRAPFDGVVSARYVDPGALVPAATGSTQAALPVVDVSSTDTLRIFVYLGQDTATFVHLGDPATVSQDERPDKRIVGSVTHVAAALDPRTRTMQVEVDVDNREGTLLPGMLAHVEVGIAEPKSALISSDALVIRDGKTMVAEVNDGRVHYVLVDLGYNDGQRIRVLRGLDGGEVVGLDVPVEVQEGDVVDAVPEKAPDAGAGGAGAPQNKGNGASDDKKGSAEPQKK
jgi:membrane fusion protein, multidrug efflux system